MRNVTSVNLPNLFCITTKAPYHTYEIDNMTSTAITLPYRRALAKSTNQNSKFHKLYSNTCLILEYSIFGCSPSPEWHCRIVVYTRACADFPTSVERLPKKMQHFFVFLSPVTLIFDLWPWRSNSGEILYSPPNCQVSSPYVGSFGSYRANKKQTDKQTDAAENIHLAALCYAGTVGKEFDSGRTLLLIGTQRQLYKCGALYGLFDTNVQPRTRPPTFFFSFSLFIGALLGGFCNILCERLTSKFVWPCSTEQYSEHSLVRACW